MMNKHILISVSWVLHPSSGVNVLCLGPKYRKISPQRAPFAYFFRFSFSCDALNSHGLRWAPLW